MIFKNSFQFSGYTPRPTDFFLSLPARNMLLPSFLYPHREVRLLAYKYLSTLPYVSLRFAKAILPHVLQVQRIRTFKKRIGYALDHCIQSAVLPGPNFYQCFIFTFSGRKSNIIQHRTNVLLCCHFRLSCCRISPLYHKKTRDELFYKEFISGFCIRLLFHITALHRRHGLFRKLL